MSVSKEARQVVLGTLAVFLIYFYFLQFSQFTLLHLLEQRVNGAARVKLVLAGMALSGVAGSVLAVLLRRRGLAWRLFLPGFATCGAIALAAPHARGAGAFLLLACVMGLAVGMLTVATAGLLPSLLAVRRRGLLTGTATGLAYAASNLPWLFQAGAERRAVLIGAVLLAGAVPYRPWWSRSDAGSAGTQTHSPLRTLRSWGWIVAAFLLVIWLDSALFYIIQETDQLKAGSWGGTAQLTLNGLIHLVAAAGAGWMLDRGWLSAPVPLAWAGLAAGAIGLQATGLHGFTLLYVAAVSIYSCALVYLPSGVARTHHEDHAFLRAASAYAVAGWFGSAMGIGMAENLHRIPVSFIIFSGILLVPALLRGGKAA